MKDIDPRIAERRRHVAEQQARHGVRNMLWLVVAVSFVGVVGWIVNLPFFSVNLISISGNERSDVEGALESAGLAEGMPLVMAPIDKATQGLLADPWIVDARVVKVYPDIIEIQIVEHVPVATLVTLNGTGVVAEDGSLVIFGDGVEELPKIQLGTSLPLVGAVAEKTNVIGAAEFYAALPTRLSAGSSIYEVDGELWAVVDGFDVRLGLPNSMAEKARSLTAVLDIGQASGSIINVIAPARPTVRPPYVPGVTEEVDGDS